MAQFDRQFPHTEFECLIGGKNDDAVQSLQKGRAQIGLIEARDDYPTDIGATRLPVQSWMRLMYDHASVGASQTNSAMGTTAYPRELRPNTYLNLTPTLRRGPASSAPNYLLLLSMAVMDLLVRIALRAGVEEFAAEKPLARLRSRWPEGDC